LPCTTYVHLPTVNFPFFSSPRYVLLPQVRINEITIPFSLHSLSYVHLANLVLAFALAHLAHQHRKLITSPSAAICGVIDYLSALPSSASRCTDQGTSGMHLASRLLGSRSGPILFPACPVCLPSAYSMWRCSDNAKVVRRYVTQLRDISLALLSWGLATVLSLKAASDAAEVLLTVP